MINMKKIFSFVTTLVAFFCIIPTSFAQIGGSSPDTALSNLVGFVTVRRPPPDPTSARIDNDIFSELDTYMVIITGFDSEANGPAVLIIELASAGNEAKLGVGGSAVDRLGREVVLGMLLDSLSDERGRSAVGPVYQNLITAVQVDQANEDRRSLV